MKRLGFRNPMLKSVRQPDRNDGAARREPYNFTDRRSVQFRASAVDTRNCNGSVPSYDFSLTRSSCSRT